MCLALCIKKSNIRCLIQPLRLVLWWISCGDGWFPRDLQELIDGAVTAPYVSEPGKACEGKF